MSVKASHTGARVLRALEAVASHQPVGVRALARIMGEDKSAIHRAVVTLIEEGWLQSTVNDPVQWEVSARILAVANKAHGGMDLKQRARAILERLRDDCGETALLVLLDAKNLVVADVVESTNMLRVVPHIGNTVTTEKTATGRAVLSLLEGDRQRELLGTDPSGETLRIYALTRSRGYAVSNGETNAGATSVAAPIIDFDGTPIGAIGIIGPSDRIGADAQARFGRLAIHAALSLSRGVPRHP